MDTGFQMSNFSFLSDKNYKDKFNNKNENYKYDQINPFKVKTVDGYSMLLNLKRLRRLKNFNFFDENIFMYLENVDLCLRVKKKTEKYLL